MSKYIIEFIERKDTAGGIARSMANLKDETGKITQDVTLWGTNWKLDTLFMGNNIEGKIEEKDKESNGKVYHNVTLYPDMGDKPKTWGPGASATKKADIAEAQKNKQSSIELSSTFRDATQITLAELSEHPIVAEEFKSRWLYWREWLLNNFEEHPPKGF